MLEQKPQESAQQQDNSEPEKIIQEKPSHMNQGRQAFRPDEQKKNSPKAEQHSRKAS